VNHQLLDQAGMLKPLELNRESFGEMTNNRAGHLSDGKDRADFSNDVGGHRQQS
jgi:hypothetical protein